MEDDLRIGVLREQQARGKAILESQQREIRPLIFDHPIIVHELWSLEDEIPDEFDTVLEMLRNTCCGVSITIETDVYKNYILKDENFSWERKFSDLNDSRKFLDYIQKEKEAIKQLNDRIESPITSGIFSLIKKSEEELEKREKDLSTLYNALSLKVHNEYGTMILKIDEEEENGFFAIVFHKWRDEEPIIKKYWPPHITTSWVREAQGTITPTNKVFEQILEYHANEKEGEDSWNIGRSTAQILIQIKRHLMDERAYYENPQKLKKTTARYRRGCAQDSENLDTRDLNLSRYRLELADPEPNSYFMREGNAFTIPTADNPNRRYFIEEFIDETDTIVLSENNPLPNDVPQLGTLMKAPDTYQNEVKRSTILKLLNRDRPPKLAPLITLVTHPNKLLPFTLKEVEFINPDLQNLTTENASQRQAIQMAISTPDTVFIKGPPGTGKTTVICELAQQHIRMGQKVLVVAPTHVAVDNVLEKIGDLSGVYPIRWGSVERIDEQLKGFNLSVQRGRLREKIIKEYEQTQPMDLPPNDFLAKIQHEWIDDLREPKKYEDDEDVLESLLKSQANLVCATTIGIVGGGLIKRDTIPFDIMIIDETSKSTLAEFLVPASYARKWILVGDEKQLSPYVERDKVEEMIAIRLYDYARRNVWGDNDFLNPINHSEPGLERMSDFFHIDTTLQGMIRQYAKEVEWRLENHFQLRFSDPQARKKRKSQIFMTITNLKLNLEFERDLRAYKSLLARWRDTIEEITATYREEKEEHQRICKQKTANYEREIAAYERSKIEIRDYPALVEAKRQQHEIHVQQKRVAFEQNQQKKQEHYENQYAKYLAKLEELKRNKNGKKKPKPPKSIESEAFFHPPFLAPPMPTPLPKADPPIYPSEPKKPVFPKRPKRPEEPAYLTNIEICKKEFIDDYGNHLWKSLQTICEFEFNSGFEVLLNLVIGGAAKNRYHVVESHPRVSQLFYQFRMHPRIAEFNSEVVYDGMYQSAEITNTRGLPLTFNGRSLNEAILFLDTSRLQPYCEERLEESKYGKKREGKIYNLAEARVIAEMVNELERDIRRGALAPFKKNDRPWEIGVITFYEAQAQCIKTEIGKYHKALDKWVFDLADGKARLQVSIVDRFQGKEKDIILLSFTRSNPKYIQGFLKVLNRLNVATTRAREKLILVGNVEFLKKVHKGLIPRLVEYVRENGIIINITRDEVGLSKEGIGL